MPPQNHVASGHHPNSQNPTPLAHHCAPPDPALHAFAPEQVTDLAAFLDLL